MTTAPGPLDPHPSAGAGSAVTAWVDGRLIDPGEPSVGALDHGITVGDGVFETCLVRQGVPFALTRHLRRLATSAAGMGLPEPDEQRLRDAVDVVLRDQTERHGGPLRHGRLRITMTGGAGPLGSGRGDAPPTYLVLASPVPVPGPTESVHLVPWTRNEHSAVAGLKTTSYAENVVALARAHVHGAGEALFANTRGELCEGTGTNVVVVLDGQAVTPPLSSGALAGITRQLLLEWAAAEGVPVLERSVPIAELEHAQEVLLTSSTRNVQPVALLDGRALPTPGPVGRILVEMFQRRAETLVDP